MADQIRDILSQLKDHEQQPPESLFGRIQDAAREEMNRDALDLKLKELGEYEIAPQESHYITISKSVKGNPNNIRTLFYRLGALAAVLFFFFAAWAIYRLAWNTPAIKATETAALSPAAKPSSQSPLVPVNIPAIATDSNARILVAETKTYRVTAPVYSASQAPRLSGSGESFSWVDNDLLYSVLNCRYSAMEPYFKDESRQLIVDVDQYSSTAVSEKMLQFMKTMYRTNKKNKPTFKAKKAKRKLEKWKKADATYFDKPGNNHNPLDIIDLTRFVAGEKDN